MSVPVYAGRRLDAIKREPFFEDVVNKVVCELKRPIVVLIVALLSWVSVGDARAKGPKSGFELALHGTTEVPYGKTARFRGIAYQVTGLAQLKALPNAKVRARYASDAGAPGPWKEIRAGQNGLFSLALAMPQSSKGASWLELFVGNGTDERRFEFPLELTSPWSVDLRTDRHLYEPGETIHAWARIRDVDSLRPLNGKAAVFEFGGTEKRLEKGTTGLSGVISANAKIPKEVQAGDYELLLRVGNSEIRHVYQIGTRSYDRIFARVEVLPTLAKPHGPVEVKVYVTTASGAVVPNAKVEVKLGESIHLSKTNSQGVAIVKTVAPAYMKSATSTVSIVATVSHAAQGATTAEARLRLAVPLTLEIEAVPDHGGLVPGMKGRLYVRVRDGNGDPPTEGLPVEVTGAAVARGSYRGTTDEHGIVTVPTALALGASASEFGMPHTSVVVRVLGRASRTAVIDIDVSRKVDVLPTVSASVVSPGQAMRVRIERRGAAKKLPVVVDLLAGETLVQTHVLRPGRNEIRFQAPIARLGVIVIRARSLQQGSVVEGTGGVDAFLIRPPHPSFASMEADKKVYEIGDAAQITLKTNSNAGQSWVALVVRDLAAHAGELPFRLTFLEGAFDRAVLDPAPASAKTLLAVALANYTYLDASPTHSPALVDALGQDSEEEYMPEYLQERGILRDPFPRAQELRRRGMAQVMTGLEEELEQAIAEDRLADIAVRSRGRYRFSKDALELLEDLPRTLGDGHLELAMLQTVDPSFSYDNVARRVARRRLVRLLVALSYYLDPGEDASVEQRAFAREPSARWFARMIERGLLSPEDLLDPWGHHFVLRKTAKPSLAIAITAAHLELVSPGPDGIVGTKDDMKDPFARVVPKATPYAIASGEDLLMLELSQLSPGSEVLLLLAEAYNRVTEEVREEEIGDAVGASLSEGYGSLGGIGHGGGGTGSGSGYGRGRMMKRKSLKPSVKIGAANARGGMSGFAQVLRERFPPTLLFTSSMSVDPSGVTNLSIPLSDAITSYLVEAVVWSEDGWTWSAHTTIRVDKGLVIDAPIPRYAMVGDEIDLPLRIGNRKSKDRRVDIAMASSVKGALLELQNKRVVAKAGDIVVAPVRLRFTRPMKGHITVGVSEKGVALDAVKRPISVLAPLRQVRRSVEFLASGRGDAKELQFQVESSAVPREGSELLIRVGQAIFSLPAKPLLADWGRSWTGQGSVSAESMRGLEQRDLTVLAQSIAVVWGASEVKSDRVSDAMKLLTEHLGSSAISSTQRAEALLGLGPVVHQFGRRKALATDMKSILRKLRSDVLAAAMSTPDQTNLWALSAAGLALTMPPGGSLSQIRELARRVRREVLVVGSMTWVATRKQGHATSVYLALAEMKLGEQGRAAALLQTLGTLALGERGLGDWPLVLAHVALRESRSRRSAQLTVMVDGKKTQVSLVDGFARIAMPVLGRAGLHRISLAGDAKNTLYSVQARSEYGLPWHVGAAKQGALVTELEGQIRGRGQRSDLFVIVHNRSPRAIANPVLQISMPAGAELDEEGLRIVRKSTVGQSLATRGVLKLQLPGLAPGAVARIPLPFRWSLAGRLTGLGIASYPADRPEDVGVLPPRVVSISNAEGN